ncbi:Uncharacterised protein [Wolbachia endosymbiont wPip_Mol of Culex molestus]|nr:Uncharacterised protein [Wolbachia endosymbiont wPip_Mol of Culex molestus]
MRLREFESSQVLKLDYSPRGKADKGRSISCFYLY